MPRVEAFQLGHRRPGQIILGAAGVAPGTDQAIVTIDASVERELRARVLVRQRDARGRPVGRRNGPGFSIGVNTRPNRLVSRRLVNKSRRDGPLSVLEHEPLALAHGIKL